ncbi:bestrophin family protein [Mycobacterium sp. NBC_00419]|uniref:bestrophin family ion channel n=1 Tax=Mycobacterium sp. NBC_00419 TaxID=2975989 RepID=UPI002E23E876
MIRSVGVAGPVKVAWVLVWQLRYDLLAVVIVAALMMPIPDAVQSENALAVLSVLGIAASIFIGFRNSNAYARWWEARTLWGGIIINSRALHNGLQSVDTGAAAMAPIVNRMRRRQVRHAWQLAAEMRGIPAVPGVVELTPEDPADASATDLIVFQADDIHKLRAGRYIDDQARVMLMAANTGTVTAQSGLERVRNQPVPIHYDLFIRAMAWFFGIMVFNRLDGASHHIASIVIGFLVMAVFVIAERVGHFIEEPMSNTVFDLPMYRLCTLITGNLLGAGHPLAQPQDSATAMVWR